MKSPSVLILGAGINGAALARELVLGGISVALVDSGDLAGGATSYSSRLIHGGLRYLEYGELDLVRESLAERTRWLRLAPHLVSPLKLYIPVASRLGGLRASVGRFLGWKAKGAARSAPPRGLWLVRSGLWLYDRYARDPALPRHATYSVLDPRAIRVARDRYRWLCSYYDAQVRFPERFVVDLLDDARKAAGETGASLHVYTYHRASLRGRSVEIHSADDETPVSTFEPAAIVNATGAWVDWTLRQLNVAGPMLMGGTKGSHLVTSHARLRAALGDHGLYAEAGDGRPVFILPFGDLTLIGTTDVPFVGDPAEALASRAELDYLIQAVNSIVPDVCLSADEVDMHYCGVRPLPASGPATPAAITRRHWLEEHAGCDVPLYSVIGGKLTTCRSLAERAAGTLRSRLGLTPLVVSQDRPLPGGADYPADHDALEAEWRRLAALHGLSDGQARAVWTLRGTQTDSILAACGGGKTGNLTGTDLPLSFVRWVIHHEWVRRLSDLVERRLMLLYDRRLSEPALRELAGLLVEAGLLKAGEIEAEVGRTIERLKTHFGKRLAASDSGGQRGDTDIHGGWGGA
ncbi:MAG TPA: glycerol-3-phosphate dehydrogenase/oxidase [Pirellulales bacterium]|nr:glycerol-3-phosphate dehydrogenase/oxidase [Pirellulales bacterium]